MFFYAVFSKIPQLLLHLLHQKYVAQMRPEHISTYFYQEYEFWNFSIMKLAQFM